MTFNRLANIQYSRLKNKVLTDPLQEPTIPVIGTAFQPISEEDYLVLDQFLDTDLLNAEIVVNTGSDRVWVRSDDSILELSVAGSASSLTGGNGITLGASGSIDLGGTLNQPTIILGNNQTFDLGTTASQLSFLRINAIQSYEQYLYAGEGLTITQNPGTFKTDLDYSTSSGYRSFIEQSPAVISSVVSSNSGYDQTQITQSSTQINILSRISGGPDTGFSFNSTADSFIFSDNRLTPRGLEYQDDYSADFSVRSLIDKGYLDSVISGLTDLSIYTTNGTIGSNRVASLTDSLQIGTGFNLTDSILTMTGSSIMSSGGSTDTLNINHTSGSGHGVYINKAGAGDGLHVVKTSGGGNAARISGGSLNMDSQKIINVLDPTNAQDAATKNYVDGRPDTNFANTDLTLTGNRTHQLNGNTFQLRGVNHGGLQPHTFGYDNTTDSFYFTKMGSGAAQTLDNQNLILGYKSASGGTNFSFNSSVIIGTEAGRDLSTGTNARGANTLIGTRAGKLLNGTAGSSSISNVMIGSQAGENLTNANLNIILGTYNETKQGFSQNTIISNGSVSLTNGTLRSIVIGRQINESGATNDRVFLGGDNIIDTILRGSVQMPTITTSPAILKNNFYTIWFNSGVPTLRLKDNLGVESNIPLQSTTNAITKTSAVFNRTLTLEAPTATENITIFRTDVAITIQEVIAVSTGTSPSTTYQIKHSTDRSAAGSNLTTSGTTTSTTTGDTATLSVVAIPANSWIWLITTAATGTSVKLSIDIRYTID